MRNAANLACVTKAQMLRSRKKIMVRKAVEQLLLGQTGPQKNRILLHVYFNYLKFALGQNNKTEAKSQNRLQAKPMAARFTNFQKWFGQQKLT